MLPRNNLAWIYVVLLALSCSTDPIGSSWYNKPGIDDFLTLEDRERIPDNQIYLVSSTHCREAILRLQRTECVEISNAEAVSLATSKIEWHCGLRAFLVRGITLKDIYGRIECKLYKERLLVSFLGMGDRETSIQKQPVIVFLSSKPRAVFTKCNVIE